MRSGPRSVVRGRRCSVTLAEGTVDLLSGGPTGVVLLDRRTEHGGLPPRLVGPVDVASHGVKPALDGCRSHHQLPLP
jgi:hypothetical protein